MFKLYDVIIFIMASKKLSAKIRFLIKFNRFGQKFQYAH